MVRREKNLSEAALANDFQHFVPVGNVIMRNQHIGTILIVEVRVVGTASNAESFLGLGTHEKDLKGKKSMNLNQIHRCTRW